MTSLYPIMPSSTSHPSPLTLRRCTTINRPNLQQGLVIEYSLIYPPATTTTTAPHPHHNHYQTTPTHHHTPTAHQTNDGQLESCDINAHTNKLLPPLAEVTDTTTTTTTNSATPYNNTTTTARRHSRPWLALSNPPASNITPSDKRRRLERLNLRSENRGTISRGSISHRTNINNNNTTNSSCKRSDSATNTNTNDSQKSALTANSLEDRLSEDRSRIRQIVQLEQVQKDEELTEEKMEQRKNFEKCMNWIDALPSKFSGMHIAQERAPVTKD